MQSRQPVVRTVPEAYPELLHYTSVAGLAGILDSQSLRMTHSSFLNDSTEISLFFKHRLAKVLEIAVRAELAADPTLRVLPQFARTPEESEATILRYVREMRNAIQTTTSRFNQPYLACFSSPATDRIRSDGLLSQWRAYGKDGGYALLFDSKKLEELLRSEVSTFCYQYVQWGDVHYYHPDDDDLSNAEPEIAEAENALRQPLANTSGCRSPENWRLLSIR